VADAISIVSPRQTIDPESSAGSSALGQSATRRRLLTIVSERRPGSLMRRSTPSSTSRSPAGAREHRVPRPVEFAAHVEIDRGLAQGQLGKREAAAQQPADAELRPERTAAYHRPAVRSGEHDVLELEPRRRQERDRGPACHREIHPVELLQSSRNRRSERVRRQGPRRRRGGKTENHETGRDKKYAAA
jgi:hypothetical protein